MNRYSGVCRLLALASIVLCNTALSSQPAERPSKFPTGLLQSERNTIEVFQRVSGSVVFITTSDLRRDFFSRNVMEIPRGSGSGFLWDRHGHVVTNSHVVHRGASISVTLADGSRHRAKLVGEDTTKDLAVLRIDDLGTAFAPVELGDSDTLVVGQKVLAIGNPFGLDHTLTTGIISALGREIPSLAGTTIQDVIQTDASINPGNSGGPLLDSHGRLVGINTSIYSPSGASVGIGFAVPVGTVKRVVPQLIKYGRVKRAGLGITVIPDDLARSWGIRGVIVRGVLRGSSAARVGLRSTTTNRWGQINLGDIIVGIDDHRIEDFDDLFTALDLHDPKDVVTIHYRRGKRKGKVELRLQEIRVP